MRIQVTRLKPGLWASEANLNDKFNLADRIYRKHILGAAVYLEFDANSISKLRSMEFK
jgi:hypothetical protein